MLSPNALSLSRAHSLLPAGRWQRLRSALSSESPAAARRRRRGRAAATLVGHSSRLSLTRSSATPADAVAPPRARGVESILCSRAVPLGARSRPRRAQLRQSHHPAAAADGARLLALRLRAPRVAADRSNLDDLLLLAHHVRPQHVRPHRRHGRRRLRRRGAEGSLPPRQGVAAVGGRRRVGDKLLDQPRRRHRRAEDRSVAAEEEVAGGRPRRLCRRRLRRRRGQTR